MAQWFVVLVAFKPALAWDDQSTKAGLFAGDGELWGGPYSAIW